MIGLPANTRVWLAAGHTDMRRGMQSLALAVQESLKRDPHAGDLYIFRGRRGELREDEEQDRPRHATPERPRAGGDWRPASR